MLIPRGTGGKQVKDESVPDHEQALDLQAFLPFNMYERPFPNIETDLSYINELKAMVGAGGVWDYKGYVRSNSVYHTRTTFKRHGPYRGNVITGRTCKSGTQHVNSWPHVETILNHHDVRSQSPERRRGGVISRPGGDGVSSEA